jgi:TPR repeat protein
MIARNVTGWGILGWDIQVTESAELSLSPMTDTKKIANRVAALLQRGEKSPAGTPASTVSKAADLYAKGFAAAQPSSGEPNWREAAYWYGLAAKQGHASAYTQLGLIIFRGLAGNSSDPTGAAALWLRGALLGDGTAALNLGKAYEKGIGVPIDLAAALSWYEMAASRDEPRAAAALQQLKQRLQ